jgi:O-antigen biosynthesis protein
MSNDQELEALRRENARLRSELLEMHAILARKDSQLHRILNIVAAPILAPVGRFLYVVLVPALDAWRTRRNRPSSDGGGAVYATWTAMCEKVRYDEARASRRVAALTKRPLFSVLLPVSAPSRREVEVTVASLLAQYYGEWELCIEGDALAGELADLADRDPRIVIASGEYAGSSASTLNAALARASGEYVILVKAGGRLTPDALVEIATALAASDADALYGDDDVVDEMGRRSNPAFKPDWSPDFLLSKYYIGSPSVMRRSLVNEVGGFRTEVDASCEYDLWLRVTERTERIAHIPMVLHHGPFGAVPASGAAQEASKRALTESIARRTIDGKVEEGLAPGSFRVVRELAVEPLVSIIIPTRDRLDLLARIIDGIDNRTDYTNVEVLIVDNGSTDRATLDYLAATRHRVLRDDGPFNYSRLNNRAVNEARGALVLLLNNDTDPMDPGWLGAMVEQAVRPEVGAVGAKLLYPSGKLQHGGVALGLMGVAGSIHKGLSGNAGGHLDAMLVIRNVSVVTAACLLMRREVFEEVSGLNETELAVAYNDVDLCLRIRERGYLIVWTPHARLVHFESESRGRAVNTKEGDYIVTRWGESVFRDPYYSPNFTIRIEDTSQEISKPDGLREGLVRPAVGSMRVRMDPGRRAAIRFWSTHDLLAGIALWTDPKDRTIEGARVSFSLYSSFDYGERSTVIARAESRLSAASSEGELFLLFDAPIADSRDGYVGILEAHGIEVGRPPHLRASGPDSPAFRLFHR